MECFRATWKARKAWEVSFDSLNKDTCDADVSVRKDEAAFTAGAERVPRATRSTAHTGRTAALGRPVLHTLHAHLLVSSPLSDSLLTELAPTEARVGRKRKFQVVISTLES